MNTNIWGPPLWRVLHSLSFLRVGDDLRAPVVRFMQSLAWVLPCVYCRDSYRSFYSELSSSSPVGNLSRVIASGHFPEWMYELHEKVNAKLDAQAIADSMRLEVSQCPPGIRGKTLSFECLQKRYTVRPVSAGPQDVFDVLFIFALNYSPPSDRTKRGAYRVFLRSLSTVLRVLAAPDPHLRELQRVYSAHLVHLSAANTTRALFRALAWIWADYHGVRPTPEMIEVLHRRYSVARASACRHGACK